MRLQRPLAVLAVFATIVLSAAPACAQQRRQPAPGNSLGQNAALCYWQAFAHLPKLEPVGSDAPEPDLAKALESGKDALLYLHRGAAIGPCDWGLHPEDGPYLLLPHLSKGRDLSRLACMRVKQDLAGGKSGDAVEVAADSLVMGRHLSADLTAIISYLVQLMVERSTIETLAAGLAGADPAALEALDRRLAALPQGGSLAACMRVERDLGTGWAIRELQKMDDAGPWKDRVLGPYSFNEGGPQPAKIEALAAAAGGTRQGALKQFEALTPYYDELDTIIKLPRDQFRARLDALQKRAAGNPFVEATLPAMGRVYDNDAAGRTRLTMLKAAVAILRGGPERAKEFKDAAGAALEYHQAPGGFELRSSVVEKDMPVVLKVGGKR